jgi:hypothetical protein
VRSIDDGASRFLNGGDVFRYSQVGTIALSLLVNPYAHLAFATKHSLFLPSFLASSHLTSPSQEAAFLQARVSMFSQWADWAGGYSEAPQQALLKALNDFKALATKSKKE